MRLSVCMIVKDEAPILRSALDGVRGHAHEIIVVDGGSIDETVAIARASGARVFIQPGGFSVNRNRALSEATGDYCLMIDADEIVEARTWNVFSEFVREGRHPRGRILVISDTAEGTASVWITRVCVNDGRFHYEGVIHEP